jgi:ABC-type uncharacterized transport system permease subunit
MPSTTTGTAKHAATLIGMIAIAGTNMTAIMVMSMATIMIIKITIRTVTITAWTVRVAIKRFITARGSPACTYPG